MGLGYMGGKSQIAQKIVHTISPLEPMWRAEGRAWVEPFVGGANVIELVGGARFANDIDSELIALLSAVADGYLPPANVSREEYYRVKESPSKYSPEYRGFVSICCSFGSKKWGGYASNARGDNYARAGRRALERMAGRLRGVTFSSVGYRHMRIPPRSIIYCDPPYKGTTGYKSGAFNHDEFYHWCREMSKREHSVFVSEYDGPGDFSFLWEHNVCGSIDSKANDAVKRERLFSAPLDWSEIKEPMNK